MRKRIITSLASLALATALGLLICTGCGKTEAPAETATIQDEEVALEAEPATEVTEETADAETVEAASEATTDVNAPVFTKGVYACYEAGAKDPEKTFFYIFEGDGAGHSEDGEAITGKYFDYEIQEDGNVKFTFGGQETIEDLLTVKSVDNGVVTGSFEDTIDLVFEPVRGEDADTFDAANYVRAARGEDLVYTDGNGWRIKYDPKNFVINQGGPITTIVYVGESAGTNMITATYTIENKAEAAIRAIGEPYGENALYTEGNFPGTENVHGYWVTIPPEADGSGYYTTALARDYMDGSLIFQLDGHVGNDEENNMLVADELAAIIDSLEFPYENN